MAKKLSTKEIHYLETWLGLTLNDPLTPDVLGRAGFSALTAPAVKPILIGNNEKKNQEELSSEPGITPSGRGKRSNPSSQSKTSQAFAFSSDTLGYLSAEDEYFYSHAMGAEAPSKNSLEGEAGIFFARRRDQLIRVAGAIAYAVFDTQALDFLRWTRRYVLIKHSGSPRKGRPVDQWLLNWVDPLKFLPPSYTRNLPPEKIRVLSERRERIRNTFLNQWQNLEKTFGLGLAPTMPERWSRQKRAFYEELWSADVSHWSNAAFFPVGYPDVTQDTIIQLLKPFKDARYDWDPCKYALTDQFDWIIAGRNHQPIEDPRYDAMKRMHLERLATMPKDPIVEQWMQAVSRGEFDPNDDTAITRFLNKALEK